MPWTALHASLGAISPNLTFDLIEQACHSGIEETAALDWKEKLPLTAVDAEHKSRQQTELAKDVAAMANSGGGIIVFGVAESVDAGSSAADHVSPVGTVTDTDLQTIRQVASNLIFPPVVGLDLYRLAPANDSAAGVLALVVPDSPQRPHLLHPRGNDKYEYFMCPYRHGAHTERMVEPLLASAYRERELRARARRDTLDERWDAVLASVNDGKIWQVAVAVPESPALRPRDFTRAQANAIFSDAIRQNQLGAFGVVCVAASQTRPGLQCFVRVGAIDVRTRMGNARAGARVELHGDGSVVVAATRAGAFPADDSVTADGSEVVTIDLEQIGRDLLRLLVCAQVRRGFHADYLARIGISRATQIFRQPDPHLQPHMRPWNEERILNFRPVDGPILGQAGERTMVTTTFDLVRDAVNQAGAELWTDPNEVVVLDRQ